MDRRGDEKHNMTRRETIVLVSLLLVVLGFVVAAWLQGNLDPNVRFNVGDEVAMTDTHNFPQNTVGNKGTITAVHVNSKWYRCSIYYTVKYIGKDGAEYEEEFKWSGIDVTEDAKYKRKKLK